MRLRMLSELRHLSPTNDGAVVAPIRMATSIPFEGMILSELRIETRNWRHGTQK